MPRPKPTNPPVHRHASGQARVRIAGKDIYLGKFGSVEAARAYADLLERLASGEDATKKVAPATPDVAVVTIAVVVSRWFDEEGPRFGPESREVAQYKLAVRPLLRLYGSLPAAEFTCDHLERIQMALASGSWRTEKDRGWHVKHGRPVTSSRGVVNRTCVRIRTIFRWAERKRLVPAGTFAHLRTLPGLRANDGRVRHTQRPQPATMREVNAVIKHLPPVGVALLLVQYWTGMRSAEVRTMRAGEVDTSGEVWLYRPAKHKMSHRGQGRVVAIGRRAQAVLRSWLASKSPAEYVFTPSKLRRSEGCYTREGYAQLIRRAATAAGLPGWHAYRCRHSCRMRVAAKHGLEAAKSVLGHSHVSTTELYGRLDEALARRTAADMG